MNVTFKGRMIVRFDQKVETNEKMDAINIANDGDRYHLIQQHLLRGGNELGSLRFRNLGDRLAKGERPLGMIADGTFEFIEFLGSNGAPLITDKERAAIVAELESEQFESEFERYWL